MAYKKNFITLVFLLLNVISCSNKKEPITIPSNECKILILSKYYPKEILISIKQAKLFYNNKSLNLENQEIYIKKNNHEINLKINNHNYSTDYISIISEKFFTIEIKKNRLKRNYDGELEIYPGKESLTLINKTLIEKYIHAAAIAELGILLYKKTSKKNQDEKRLNLTKSMEIAIRSFLLSNKNRHSSDKYQYCDLTHCIHFPGLTKNNIKSMTEGIVMVNQKGKIIPAYFHSTCGGLLSGPEAYWPKHKYYENFRRDRDSHLFKNSFCQKSPHSNWSAFVSNEIMFELTGINVTEIKTDSYKEKHTAIKFFNFSRDRRCGFLIFNDKKGNSKTLTCWKFLSLAGRKLGWNVLKSNYFVISKTNGGWLFKGKGLGHGIGLCQWGAWKMSQDDYSYVDILNFYYNDPGIEKVIYNKQD